MQIHTRNKKKIINDPVYGFINIPSKLIFRIIESPYFQRLRNIKQLGLTNLIYPGANHTRFQHALGAMHLMTQAIDVIRAKGHKISKQEAKSVIIAILLHDIGHGPFSHTLEYSFLNNVSHEDVSLLFMERLNKKFNNKLETAIKIFRNQYPKKFLHQLVSSQLDMDRLDYLKRDSFFTGVSEGVIGSDRIIKMLNVINDNLVVEEKGIYSIEKFLIARRLMYWQVYLHKTVVAAEEMLIKILDRAKHLSLNGVDVPATPNLKFLLKHRISKKVLSSDKKVLNGCTALDVFSQLDDNDIISSVKSWQYHDDKVLAYLSKSLILRRLFKIEIQDNPFDNSYIEKIKTAVKQKLNFTEKDLSYIVLHDSVSNNAYSISNDNIKILAKNGKLRDIAQASDISNVKALSKTVKKYFLIYPKECRI